MTFKIVYLENPDESSSTYTRGITTTLLLSSQPARSMVNRVENSGPKTWDGNPKGHENRSFVYLSMFNPFMHASLKWQKTRTS